MPHTLAHILNKIFPHSHTSSSKIGNTEGLYPKILEVFKQGYTLSDLLKDIFAGISVGVVAIPLAMAFAIASGVSPIHGLYTPIIVGIVAALLGGSKYQISGPSGAFVIIMYSIIYRYGYDGLVLALLMAGAILIIAGFFRLGSLVKFIPYPVTMGFTAGIGMIIFSQQVGDVLGMPLESVPPEFFEKWFVYFHHLTEISWITVGVSLGTFIIMLLVRKYKPSIPAPVIGVLFGIILVYFFQVPIETIGSKYGALPSALPQFHLPSYTLNDIELLLPDAITIALLVSIESLLTCVVADSMTGDKHYPNMELIAQGAGNIASGLFGGIAATGATARTATNINSGAVSPVASLVHSLVIFIFVIFLSPVLSAIPLACLAIVLVIVSYGMFDLRAIKILFKGPKSDWSVMLLTFILTLAFDLTVAVYVGVTLASLLFMRRMSVQTQIMAETNSEEDNCGLHPLADDIIRNQRETPDAIRIVNIDGPLFFGVADRFQSALANVSSKPKIYIIHMRHVSAIDASGIHALETFLSHRSDGYKVIISSPSPDTKKILARMGIIRNLGKDNICTTLDIAIERAKALLDKENPQKNQT